MAWTVVSKPECTDRTVRATCTGWKPVPRGGVGEAPTLRKPARVLKQSLRSSSD
ncbi:MAG: hypothetical protein NZ874_03270 [Fimbriimonadales bacterium]|nr:hypothetical protein [Fimbriimonadales bacterium]